MCDFYGVNFFNLNFLRLYTEIINKNIANREIIKLIGNIDHSWFILFDFFLFDRSVTKPSLLLHVNHFIPLCL